MKKLLFVLGILVAALVIAGCGSETTETAEGETTEETAPAEVVAEQPAVEETGDEAVVEEATESAEEAAAEEEATETETTEETTTEEVVAEETTEAAYEGASQAGCTDSDGGKNYELAGNIVDARGVTDFDRCSENENYPGRLYESYCEEDGSHGRETYDCPSDKCSAGACVAAEEATE
ncbi:hypothetical protein HZC31_05535 [Candidatus Woesearchaeota archaeon]|nr:hypothetical protein [Candidatus Woesearchaeota archaeon]